MRRHAAAFLFAIGVSLASLVASAATNVLVNDTWQDGTDTDPVSPTYAENNGFTGVDADADNDLESAWYLGTGGGPPVVSTLAVVGTPGGATPPAAVIGSPNLMQLKFSGSLQTQSASVTTYFTPEGNEVNLANSGDSMKVTWVFTPTNVNTSNTSQNFRIAVVDSPSAARLAINGSPGTAAYAGYGIFANMGQTMGINNSYRLMERTGASGAMLGTSGDWTAIATTGANGNHGYDNGTQYTFLMTITRTALGELQVDSSITGGTLNNSGTASVSFLDTTPNNGNFKFDTFSVRPSGATTTAEIIDTSLFKVEYTTTAAPPILAGDYNSNNVVDAGDYAVWRDNFGAAAGTLPNDPAGGVIGPAQYTQWAANFGKTLGSGSTALDAGTVPEPGTLLLAAVAAMGCLSIRRRA